MAKMAAPVTRPTIPNFNLQEAFRSFGYEPTQEEIDMMIPAFSGRYNIEQTGRTAIANYVNSVRKEEERRKNDPLLKFVEEQRGKVAGFEKESESVYQELKGIIQKAPKLFGSLTDEQIDQYLAPIRRASQESSARVEGAMGRRGMVGSSTEANALAEQDRLFQQNALSTGLQVGLTQQEQEARILQNRLTELAQKYGIGISAIGGGTGQMSSQDLQQTQYLSQLPIYLQQLAMQQNAMNTAANAGSKTDWGSIGSLAGMAIGAGLAPFTGGMSIPMGMGLGSSIGGGVGSLASGDMGGGAASFGQVPWWLMSGGTKGGSKVPSYKNNAIPTTAEWTGLL